MSIRSLADFNGVASSTVRCVVGTGTVAIQVANAVDQVMRGVGTFVAIRGDLLVGLMSRTHGHGQPEKRAPGGRLIPREELGT